MDRSPIPREALRIPDEQRQFFDDDDTEEAGMFLARQQFRVEFCFDSKAQCVYSSFRRDGDVAYDNPVTGRSLQVTPADSYLRSAIVTPDDTFYVDEHHRSRSAHRLFPGVPASDSGSVTVYRKPKTYADSHSCASDIFDPRRLFECFGASIPDMLEASLGHIESTRQEVVYRQREDSNGRSELRWMVGGVEHFLAIRGHGRYSLIEEAALSQGVYSDLFTDTWEYQRYGDVLIPAKYVRRHISPEGGIVSGRDVTVIDSTLNKRIPGEMFTVSALRPMSGDRFVDEIDSRTALFHEGALISADEYLAELHPRKTRVPFFLIFANLLVISVLFFILWRQKRGSCKTENGV